MDFCLEDFVEDMLDKVRDFSIGEFGILKTALVSFGLLVGAFHARKVRRYGLLLLIAFLLSATYLMIRLCFDEDEDDDFYDEDEDGEENEELAFYTLLEEKTEDQPAADGEVFQQPFDGEGEEAADPEEPH